MITALLVAGAACAMALPRPSFELPAQGIVWLEGADGAGPCPRGAEPATLAELQVSAEGPEGSGRFWTVTVAHGERGVCFTASTVGWRTLRDLGGPLPWIADTDEDGVPELLVWQSFPLEASGSPAAQGLQAWVYEWDDGTASLRLDLPLSRAWARRLADAYAKPGDAPPELRAAARRRLLDLADGRCTLEASEP